MKRVLINHKIFLLILPPAASRRGNTGTIDPGVRTLRPAAVDSRKETGLNAPAMMLNTAIQRVFKLQQDFMKDMVCFSRK